MRRDDFDDFNEVVIKKCIDEIFKCANSEGLDCAIKLKSNSSKNIFKNYQFQRDYIVSNYMEKNISVALDRHKVAACMVYAILKTMPIKVNRRICNLPEKFLLVNEYLAFYIGLNIIEMYKLDETGHHGEYQIIVPKTYYEEKNSNNTYESNLCKAWSYIRLDSMKRFDVLAYAHIFFLLEKYTDLSLELQIL